MIAIITVIEEGESKDGVQGNITMRTEVQEVEATPSESAITNFLLPATAKLTKECAARLYRECERVNGNPKLDIIERDQNGEEHG